MPSWFSSPMELLSNKSKSSSEVGLEGCGAGVAATAGGSDEGVEKGDGMGVRLRPDTLVRLDGKWKSGTVKPGRENPGG